MRGAVAILVAVALVACGGEHDHDDHAGHDHAGHDHGAHEASHGGALIELTGHAGHVEAKADLAAGTLTVWVTDADMSPMALDEPPVLNLVTADGPVQVTGEQDGEAWRFRHEALKSKPQTAHLRLKSGSTTHTPPLTVVY